MSFWHDVSGITFVVKQFPIPDPLVCGTKFWHMALFGEFPDRM